MNDEILHDINEIEYQECISEMNVLNSLMDCYMKQDMIIKRCANSSQVIQEGVFGNAYEMTKQELEGKNVVVKVLTFLIKYIKNFFKSLFNKNKQTVKTMESIQKQVKEIDDNYENIQNEINQFNRQQKEINDAHGKIVRSGDINDVDNIFGITIKDDKLYFLSTINFKGMMELMDDIIGFCKDVNMFQNSLKTKEDLKRMDKEIKQYSDKFLKLVKKYTNGQLERGPREQDETIRIRPYIQYEKGKQDTLTIDQLNTYINDLKKRYNEFYPLYDEMKESTSPYYGFGQYQKYDKNDAITSEELWPFRQLTCKLCGAFMIYETHIHRRMCWADNSLKRLNNFIKDYKNNDKTLDAKYSDIRGFADVLMHDKNRHLVFSNTL